MINKYTTKDEIFNQIEENDLTDELQILSEIIGIDSIRKLIKQAPSVQLYIPKLTRLDKFISRYIKDNPMKKCKELAYEFGVSERFIKLKYFKKRRNVKVKR